MYDDDISETDPHIQCFWRVLRSFDDSQRSAFLRFVWARSRLPATQDFHQKFKIQAAVGEGQKGDADKSLPKAHTCFFSLNLPKYSNDEVTKKQLLYAVENCIGAWLSPASWNRFSLFCVINLTLEFLFPVPHGFVPCLPLAAQKWMPTSGWRRTR